MGEKENKYYERNLLRDYLRQYKRCKNKEAVLRERIARIKEYKKALSYIFMLVCTAGILLPLFSLISAVQSAVQGMAAFMTSFVPIYAGILTVGGRSMTASTKLFSMRYLRIVDSALFVR